MVSSDARRCGLMGKAGPADHLIVALSTAALILMAIPTISVIRKPGDLRGIVPEGALNE